MIKKNKRNILARKGPLKTMQGREVVYLAWLITRASRVQIPSLQPQGGMAEMVDSGGLENRLSERVRGFKSLSRRH